MIYPEIVEPVEVPVYLSAAPSTPARPFVMFAPVRLVRFAPLTAPKLPLHVPEVIVPTVTRFAALVIAVCVAPVTVAALPDVF